MKLVLICGARDWDDEELIDSAIARLATIGVLRLMIVTGGAPGADTIAESKAKQRGIHVAVVDALWDVYKKGAGPYRNSAMLSLQPDLVVAFHRDIGKSKGTAHCVGEARELGIPVRVIAGKGR